MDGVGVGGLQGHAQLPGAAGHVWACRGLTPRGLIPREAVFSRTPASPRFHAGSPIQRQRHQDAPGRTGSDLPLPAGEPWREERPDAARAWKHGVASAKDRKAHAGLVPWAGPPPHRVPGGTYCEGSNADRSSALGLRLNQQNRTKRDKNTSCDIRYATSALHQVSAVPVRVAGAWALGAPRPIHNTNHGRGST